MFGANAEKKEKEEAKQPEQKGAREMAKTSLEKDAHIQTEGADTHHDLLPEKPVQKGTDEKTGVTFVDPGPATEMGKKEDQV